MSTVVAVDNVSVSTPSLNETERQLDLQQGGVSVNGAGVDADIKDSPVTGKQEGIVLSGSESGKVEVSGMEDHLRAIAEIEEFASQYSAEEIVIPPDLRQSLPSDVETLLSRLESSSRDDPVREVDEENLRAPGFGNLFGGSKHLEWNEKSPRELDAAMRLMVMTEVGSCKTLEAIRFSSLNLTIQELKALLHPMQKSSVLREVDLSRNNIVHAKEGCKVVADFLKINSSLRILDLGYSDNKPYISHYLATEGHPTLEVLRLRPVDIEEGSRIIRACPNLQRIVGWVWKVEDMQMATMYANFLMEHESLRHVEVEGPGGPVSSFLLSSCTRAESLTSLTGLEVELTGSDQRLWRNVLERVVLANRNLEGIFLDRVKTCSEEWQGLFRSLKENAVVKRLDLWGQIFHQDEGFDCRAWQELVTLIMESSNLELLAIGKEGECQHDLRPLFEALTSTNSGIQEFWFGGFELRLDESRAFVSCMEKNVSLRKLTLYNLQGLRWEEVFNSLRHNSALKVLVLYGTYGDTALEALLAMLQVNRALKEIEMPSRNWIREGKYDLLQYALREKERQGVVTYAFVSTSTADKPRVLQSLRHNDELQCLHLSFEGIQQFDQRTWNELEALVGHSRTLESLTIYGPSNTGFKHDLGILFNLLVFTQNNICSVTLINLEVNEEESQWLASLIQENTSLKHLSLKRVEGVHWEKLFTSLRYNTTLQTLELLGDYTLDGGAFKELLAALQVNSSLEKIHLDSTNWEREGKTAIVRVALEQKGRRETYMAAMRAMLEQEDFQLPSTGRLFLCGAGCAGKTQLRRAFTKAAARRGEEEVPWNGCFPTRTDLRRTEGIEIQLLNINSLEVSIWDLGGQTIFRALQDVLFPKLNLACVFLFVFSPFDKTANCLKPDLSVELHRELLPWLRFIASNSRIGFILPRVKIVISHRDKLHDPPRLSWVTEVINNLCLQFAELLDIDKKIFCTNSLSLGEDIDEIFNHTVKAFKDLLENKLFKVPATCLTLGSALTKRSMFSQSTPNHNLYRKRFPFPSSCLSLGNVLACRKTLRSTSEPILSTKKFFDLCRREVDAFNYTNEDGQKLLTAVAEYLHDAGTIIHMVKSDLVVVDPNWFTFSFLGRLIGAGHDFETPLVRVDPYKRQKDGHLSTHAFDDLLDKFSDILKREGYRGVDKAILKKLMEEIDLCFHVPQACGYFAPAIFAEEKQKKSSEGLRKLAPWRRAADRPDAEQGILFVGVRLQCADRLRTNVTPSFFPRFQVHFRNHVISNERLRPDQIDCDYNMIYFLMEEFEVYVESDGNPGDCIDIMVRSPTSRTKTVRFIEEKIVREIQDFCASCCPGVALAVGVLRTECAETLTLSAHRDENQAILIDDLKGRWKEFILGTDVDSRMWDEEDLAKYSYMWPSNREADLQERWERAKDLLTEEDYLEVLKSVKGTAVSMETELDGLKAVEEEIEKEIRGSSPDDASSSKQSGEPSSASQQFRPSASFRTSQDRTLRRAVSDMMVGHEKTQHEIQKLGRKFNDLSEVVKEVKSIIKGIGRDVKNVQQYQQKILATRISINSKLDQLLPVTSSLPKSEVPNRPYLTKEDVKWTHRISAAVYIGTAMTLHFMWEERNGNHLVNNQPGYPITVSKENAEVLRFLSVTSVKVLWYLLKAGVHVAAGLGNVIPDLDVEGQTTLLTASTVGTMLASLESRNVGGSQMVDSQHRFDQTNLDLDSCQYLKQLFAEGLKGRCPEYFLLYRARYVSSPQESRHAWLCRACIEKGRKINEIVFEE